ncbi:MAG TPA: serine/threonine-protein kinase [Gaiellaceae bacterium]|nr:serine/threonine-protein kinase [Gaiellaceae bacterium]
MDPIFGGAEPIAPAREGQAEAAPPSAEAWGLREGDEIAPRLLAVKLLGGGERYETYLAWDEHLYSLVVAKVVRPHLVEDEHSLQGLAAEAELAERLRHPVIVRGFGAVLDGPRPHLVLEHLEGPRLSRVIRKQRALEPEQLLPLGLQLASALHYLEEERVVHLDVKPTNVILGAPARLIDLSIARTIDDLVGVRHRIGTDAYMAPEQCDPERLGPMSSPADVWGMGATLYHGAAGRRPFPEGTRDGSREERFPQLAEVPAPLPKSVDPEVAELVLACLAFEPERRPAAAEVAAGLERLVAGLPMRPVLSRFRIRPLRGT